MAVQIQTRNGTAAQWTSANPTLMAGEIGAETDTGRFKVGNGSTAWNSLGYAASMKWLGAYSAGTAYVVNDVVSYNNSSYICILNSTGNLPTNATYWSLMALAGAGGDVDGPASSVDNQIALFDSTTGKLIKAASTTGLLKASSGVIAAASSGTDYAPATTGTNAQLLANNGSGGFSNVTVGSGLSLAAGTLTATGGGGGGGLTWQSVQTTGFTAVAGNAYPCNTTSAAFTVTLPASPSAGQQVQLLDYAGTWATNNVTVARNGSNINGLAGNAFLAVNRSAVTLTYIDSTQGWVASDAIAATSVPLVTPSVDYLVVAGGGGGGGWVGGGGGAGGYRTGSLSVASGTSYSITVGNGGNGGAYPGANQGSSGGASSFSTISSAGGGGGGSYGNPSGSTADGVAGGSGGGGGGKVSGTSTGGAGNTPSVSPSQGNAGGNAYSTNTQWASGGGGGANASGSDGGASSNGGAGGAGKTGPSFASSYGASGVFAGGGGGSGDASGGAGGSGGGGAGGTTTGGANGSSNTGGGGGGLRDATGKNGGSGVVIIAYPDTYVAASSTTGSPTVTTSGGYRIYAFTGNGSITF